MKSVISTVVACLLTGMAGAVDPASPAVPLLPPASPNPVQFRRDIQPLLESACVTCHGRGKAKGGLSMETRAALLQGGHSGPSVVVGRSGESYLIELVAGVDPDNVMPLKGSKLTAVQVGLLRAWIDQGLPWDEGVSFAKAPPRNLVPRKPIVPAAPDGLGHPVDRFLVSYDKENGVSSVQPVEDRVYARRVYLDLLGLLPGPSELEAWLRDPRADRRERLVDRLLADRQRYAEHWLSFWNDLLRNDYRGTGYIDDGRKQISFWLFSALAQNLPYDRFVSSLIDPGEEAEGFIKGIVWRGVVNASQKPEMQAAQNVAQVFMGVNLKCASCHDSFVSDWTLADSYGLASVFAEAPLEMYQCDRPTGQTAQPRFLYRELGDIPAEAPRAERQKALANIMVGPDNGRLSRTIVNRLWQRFMGRGLVEPVDDMEQPAWHPDLLDWLAADLVEHGYDLKHTMKQIVTSQAYQRPAVSLPERAQGAYVFRGPAVRRLSAEQFRDALGTVTGVWYDRPDSDFNFEAARPPGAAPAMIRIEPQWIWTELEAACRTEPGTVFWRKSFLLDRVPEQAAVVATCDNQFTLFLNGQQVLSGKDYKKPQFALLGNRLQPGENVLTVEAVNDKASGDEAGGANPAGLLVYVWMRQTDNDVNCVGSDASWQWTRQKVEGWPNPAASDGNWQTAAALGDPGAEPWHLGDRFEAALSVMRVHDHVRSSLVASDPLMTALGRPPREQLLTTRDATATTLQALEVTNGDTLTGLLRQGAKRLVEQTPSSSEALVRDVFSKALSRSPNAQELPMAQALVGEPIRLEGVEDLLWAVAMLPEFQLIY